MPLTPRGLIYPAEADHTRLWEHIQNLAESTDDALADIDVTNDAYAEYVPIWRSGAGGTAVAIGNGTAVGWWVRLAQRMIHYEFLLTRGTTTNLGTTYYTFSLPVAPHNIAAVRGAAHVFQTPAYRSLTLHGFSGSEMVMSDTPGNAVGSTPNGSLTAWAAGNRLGGSVVYRAAA